VNLVFPRRCPVCDAVVPLGEGLICRQCVSKPQYITEPRCRRCGKQLREGEQEFCADCLRSRHVFDYGYALYAQDLYRRLSHELRLMEADAIIPVPIHRSRYRRRGYNQAELVAAELSRLTGIPMYERLVTRSRKTAPQKELTIQERQNNLKKAFNISTNVVKLNKTILIDDIYTTGSTLDAVALELKRHGVKSVYFIALCIGEGM